MGHIKLCSLTEGEAGGRRGKKAHLERGLESLGGAQAADQVEGRRVALGGAGVLDELEDGLVGLALLVRQVAVEDVRGEALRQGDAGDLRR